MAKFYLTTEDQPLIEKLTNGKLRCQNNTWSITLGEENKIALCRGNFAFEVLYSPFGIIQIKGQIEGSEMAVEIIPGT